MTTDHVRNYPESRQGYDIYLGMAEKPEQVLE
jgi:hypothetical protein